MTVFYILRHAEKEQGGYFNERLRHNDEPLTAAGTRVAAGLVRFFSALGLSAIYISGFHRTKQTAGPLATHLGLPPIVDQRLNEIDNGRLDGLTEQQIQQRYPEVWSAFQERNRDFRFPGGETGAEVRARIASFLAEKQAQHTGQKVLLVSHEGWIRSLACYILGLRAYDRWRFRVDYCGLTEIAWQPHFNAWQLVRMNQVVPLS